MEADYVVIGAGAAGCVLASRIVQQRLGTVLLVEAGGGDRDPRLHVPMAFHLALQQRRLTHRYVAQPVMPGGPSETWVRGRVLGGSTAINGMVYARGEPADYDALEAAGNPGWGWAEMLPIFLAMEDHGPRDSRSREARGPLPITTSPLEGLLAHAVSRAAVGDVQPYRTPGGHRRYDPAHLDQLLVKWAPGPPRQHSAEVGGVQARASDLLGDGHHLQADLPATVRWGLRQVVKLLQAHAAGLWLRSEDPTWQLRFCAGYRIPRWLTDRLVVRPPTEPLVSLLHGGGYRMLDTNDLGIPGTVTGGRSLAVVVNEPATPPLGVVSVFTADDHRWSPHELRILQDVAMLLATIITQRIVIDHLERTLEQVQHLCSGSLPGPFDVALGERPSPRARADGPPNGDQVAEPGGGHDAPTTENARVTRSGWTAVWRCVCIVG
jgi:hypothetical protein